MHKILALTTGSGTPMLGRALWDGEQLLISKLQALKGRSGQWIPEAVKILQAAQAAGVDVIIENRASQQFYDVGRRVNFDDSDASTGGRSYLNVALDNYFALLELGAKTKKKVQISDDEIVVEGFGAICIESSLRPKLFDRKSLSFDIELDDKGRNKYSFADGSINAEVRCLLLIVLAATSARPFGESYAEELFATAMLEFDDIEPSFEGDALHELLTKHAVL